MHANVGTALLFGTYSGYIEYIITAKDHNKNSALLLKSGYGYFDEFILSDIFSENFSSRYINMQVGFITGIHIKHHFEASGGINFFVDDGIRQLSPLCIYNRLQIPETTK